MTSVRLRLLIWRWTMAAIMFGGASFGGASPCIGDDRAPPLPDRDGEVMLAAQPWPLRPGPRQIKVAIAYPGARLAGVGPKTGLMLSLHNWGGTLAVGTADPRQLAERYNVVAICLDYLQSGRESIVGPEPYDFGYLQGLDALRALHYVYAQLKAGKRPFAEGRIFATGGSGGGNVALIVNKLAPRTFDCVIDLCGMKKLSDDIAFNLPGGSDLDARWSRDPKSPYYLSADDQELRFLGCPEHLQTMRRLGNACRVLVVHGRGDTTCPFADAEEFVAAMGKAGLSIEPHFIGASDVDGKVFASTGHALGDRTKIVERVADRYLLPEAAETLSRRGSCDFERREEVRYRTSRGHYVIAYNQGYPVGRFEPAPQPVRYREHQDLTYYLDAKGERQLIRRLADWQLRRGHILANLQEVMGPRPGPNWRVPLEVKIVEEVRLDGLVRRKLTYQSDPDDRVPAYLFLPASREGAKGPATRRPAMLCLHQTTPGGKDEPSGIRGHAELRYALELARRGYVALVPDYPSFGEHAYDFAARHGYVSGSMKAVWDNIRAVDLLETLPEVDAERIGCIGHSLGGHSAMFTAALEPRLKAIVSSCGFTRFHKDDVPSWNGPRYMPRIASVYGNDADRLPFDFTELVASFAPRAFLACAAQRDNDFDVSGVRDVMAACAGTYKLHGAAARLRAYYPDSPHAFPREAREKAYEFLDEALRPVK